jgi:hypothetical protein
MMMKKWRNPERKARVFSFPVMFHLGKRRELIIENLDDRRCHTFMEFMVDIELCSRWVCIITFTTSKLNQKRPC